MLCLRLLFQQYTHVDEQSATLTTVFRPADQTGSKSSPSGIRAKPQDGQSNTHGRRHGEAQQSPAQGCQSSPASGPRIGTLAQWLQAVGKTAKVFVVSISDAIGSIFFIMATLQIAFGGISCQSKANRARQTYVLGSNPSDRNRG